MQSDPTLGKTSATNQLRWHSKASTTLHAILTGKNTCLQPDRWSGSPSCYPWIPSDPVSTIWGVGNRCEARAWKKRQKRAGKNMTWVFLEMRDLRTRPFPAKKNALRVFELFFGLELLDTLQPYIACFLRHWQADEGAIYAAAQLRLNLFLWPDTISTNMGHGCIEPMIFSPGKWTNLAKVIWLLSGLFAEISWANRWIQPSPRQVIPELFFMPDQVFLRDLVCASKLWGWNSRNCWNCWDLIIFHGFFVGFWWVTGSHAHPVQLVVTCGCQICQGHVALGIIAEDPLAEAENGDGWWWVDGQHVGPVGA